MRYLVNQEIMQTLDYNSIQQYQIPSLVLMERAAFNCVLLMQKWGWCEKKILIVCGSGNNGGDGLAMARILFLQGKAVTIYFAGNEKSMSDGCQAQMNIVKTMHIPVITKLDDTKTYDVIIDAIFGNGLNREIKGHYVPLIEKLNHFTGYKLSIDIPSGISGDTGKVLGIAFRADRTITFEYEKLGTVFYPGKEYAGKVYPVEIGIVPLGQSNKKIEEQFYTLTKKDLKDYLPRRMKNSHKGTYGKLLLIAGSRGMSGAAYLAAKAAYTTGTGLVRIYTEESNRIILQTQLPEAIISTYHDAEDISELDIKEMLEWADVVGCGSGIGLSSVSSFLMSILQNYCEKPLIIDGDGLTILANSQEHWKYHCPVILTPHKRELSRITGKTMDEINEHFMENITTFAKSQQVILAAKDSRTVVMMPERPIFINTTGNASMAKAGSGDVLMGTIAGLCAQKLDGYKATVCGVLLHGCGGDAAREKCGKYSVLATDLIDGMKQVLKDIE